VKLDTAALATNKKKKKKKRKKNSCGSRRNQRESRRGIPWIGLTRGSLKHIVKNPAARRSTQAHIKRRRRRRRKTDLAARS